MAAERSGAGRRKCTRGRRRAKTKRAEKSASAAGGQHQSKWRTHETMRGPEPRLAGERRPAPFEVVQVRRQPDWRRPPMRDRRSRAGRASKAKPFRESSHKRIGGGRRQGGSTAGGRSRTDHAKAAIRPPPRRCPRWESARARGRAPPDKKVRGEAGGGGGVGDGPRTGSKRAKPKHPAAERAALDRPLAVVSSGCGRNPAIKRHSSLIIGTADFQAGVEGFAQSS